MNTKPSISSYTPSLLDIETLESIFVKRQSLLDNIYARHKSSVLEPSKQFSLLIGPRGMGKTHLMSMLYHRFNTDKKIRNKMMIAWLREEEWGIASYLDLLTQIIKTLVNEYELQGMLEKIEHLLSLDFQSAEYEAERILSEVLQNKVLLLLAENLNLIFDSIEKEGQEKLRALIQNTGQITIIAASQSLFTAVSLRTCPFYGFFNIEHLEKLSFEDAVELLINIAKYENKHDLVELLQTEKGRVRVRALHHLAGGSPRIYVIFSQFIQADSLDEFTSPMLKMLDELTPYYQAKMLELSAQQRKLITFLCRARGAVTVQEIARQNHISQQTASGQLKKLKTSGFVESQKSGKESYYEIAEPLMRLVFSVKENRGTPVSIVIELIRHWFSLDELKQFKDDETLKAFGKSFIDANIIQQAMEVKEPSPHLISSMTEFSRHVTLNEPEKARAVISDLTIFSEEFPRDIGSEVIQFILAEQNKISGKNLNKRLLQIKNIIKALPTEYQDRAVVTYFLSLSKSLQLNEKEKITLIKTLLINDEELQTLIRLSVLCCKGNISPAGLKWICKSFGTSISELTGIMLKICNNSEKQELIKYLVYFNNLVMHCNFIVLAIHTLTNQLISDKIFFERFAQHTKIKNSEILVLSAALVQMKNSHSLDALIETVLENRKKESIYQTVMSLKAYSETGDKKSLMSLPKEMRSLIIDNQSE